MHGFHVTCVLQNSLQKNPAKGIFANVDFDALNKKKEKLKVPEEKPSEPKSENSFKPFITPKVMEDKDNESEDVFGPAKPLAPPTLMEVSQEGDESSSESDDSREWMEKRSKKSSKKSKKKEKKKRSKKKSKRAAFRSRPKA